jgi:hypothetical protein
MKISEQGISWLLQAGRLMQAKAVPGQNKFHRKIVREECETYPEAVLREIHAMPAELQSEFFDTVDWAVECIA